MLSLDQISARQEIVAESIRLAKKAEKLGEWGMADDLLMEAEKVRAHCKDQLNLHQFTLMEGNGIFLMDRHVT